MELIRGLSNVRPEHKGTVLTIGNYDGIHCGHQALLKKLREKSAEMNLPSTVITFEPQPGEYFSKDKSQPRLQRLREKLMFIAEQKIDRVIVLRFNKALSEISAQSFVEDILVSKMGMKYILVGEDFHFGHERQGDFAYLNKLSSSLGYEAEAMPAFKINDERVSSTRVRKVLEQNDLKQVEALLGRPYGMSGRVAHGDKKGRLIGFPTANIHLHRKAVPITGVYAVRVHGINDMPLTGVANIGTRPTVGGTKTLLEVHIFDFDDLIYGQYMYVEFVHKLREEKKYPDFETLKQQIFKDAEAAKLFFKSN